MIMGQGILAVVWNQAFGDVKSIDLDEYMKGHIDLVFNGLLNK